MVNVVLDSDFLSSFLKVDALHRVREYFRTGELLVPPAVYREIAVTDLLSQVTSLGWVRVREVSQESLTSATTAAPEWFTGLGAGEREAIALARDLDESVLLMSDRKALRAATELGVRAVTVPAFLLLYRSLGDEEAVEVERLVKALESKDHFGFPKAIRRRLLQTER